MRASKLNTAVRPLAIDANFVVRLNFIIGNQEELIASFIVIFFSFNNSDLV